MTSAKDICNLGLAKLGASLITSLDPPRSPLERLCAVGYPHWRDSELSNARRWTCALKVVQLTQNGPPVELNGSKLYPYDLGAQIIRPIRDRTSAWTLRGNTVYSPTETLFVEAIMRIPEDDMDVFFVELLACRVALECCETVTQSGTKASLMQQQYDRALKDAARANAFGLGQENVQTSDRDDAWVAARGGGYY